MDVQQAAVQRVRCGAQRAQHGLQVGAAPLRAPQQDVIMGPALHKTPVCCASSDSDALREGCGFADRPSPLRSTQQGVLVQPEWAGRPVRG